MKKMIYILLIIAMLMSNTIIPVQTVRADTSGGCPNPVIAPEFESYNAQVEKLQDGKAYVQFNFKAKYATKVEVIVANDKGDALDPIIFEDTDEDMVVEGNKNNIAIAIDSNVKNIIVSFKAMNNFYNSADSNYGYTEQHIVIPVDAENPTPIHDKPGLTLSIVSSTFVDGQVPLQIKYAASSNVKTVALYVGTNAVKTWNPNNKNGTLNYTLKISNVGDVKIKVSAVDENGGTNSVEKTIKMCSVKVSSISHEPVLAKKGDIVRVKINTETQGCPGYEAEIYANGSYVGKTRAIYEIQADHVGTYTVKTYAQIVTSQYTYKSTEKTYIFQVHEKNDVTLELVDKTHDGVGSIELNIAPDIYSAYGVDAKYSDFTMIINGHYYSLDSIMGSNSVVSNKITIDITKLASYLHDDDNTIQAMLSIVDNGGMSHNVLSNTITVNIPPLPDDVVGAYFKYIDPSWSVKKQGNTYYFAPFEQKQALPARLEIKCSNCILPTRTDIKLYIPIATIVNSDNKIVDGHYTIVIHDKLKNKDYSKTYTIRPALTVGVYNDASGNTLYDNYSDEAYVVEKLYPFDSGQNSIEVWRGSVKVDSGDKTSLPVSLKIPAKYKIVVKHTQKVTDSRTAIIEYVSYITRRVDKNAFKVTNDMEHHRFTVTYQRGEYNLKVYLKRDGKIVINGQSFANSVELPYTLSGYQNKFEIYATDENGNLFKIYEETITNQDYLPSVQLRLEGGGESLPPDALDQTFNMYITVSGEIGAASIKEIYYTINTDPKHYNVSIDNHTLENGKRIVATVHLPDPNHSYTITGYVVITNGQKEQVIKSTNTIKFDFFDIEFVPIDTIYDEVTGHEYYSNNHGRYNALYTVQSSESWPVKLNGQITFADGGSGACYERSRCTQCEEGDIKIDGKAIHVQLDRVVYVCDDGGSFEEWQLSNYNYSLSVNKWHTIYGFGVFGRMFVDYTGNSVIDIQKQSENEDVTVELPFRTYGDDSGGPDFTLYWKAVQNGHTVAHGHQTYDFHTSGKVSSKLTIHLDREITGDVDIYVYTNFDAGIDEVTHRQVKWTTVRIKNNTQQTSPIVAHLEYSSEDKKMFLIIQMLGVPRPLYHGLNDPPPYYDIIGGTIYLYRIDIDGNQTLVKTQTFRDFGRHDLGTISLPGKYYADIEYTLTTCYIEFGNDEPHCYSQNGTYTTPEIEVEVEIPQNTICNLFKPSPSDDSARLTTINDFVILEYAEASIHETTPYQIIDLHAVAKDIKIYDYQTGKLIADISNMNILDMPDPHRNALPAYVMPLNMLPKDARVKAVITGKSTSQGSPPQSLTCYINDETIQSNGSRTAKAAFALGPHNTLQVVVHYKSENYEGKTNWIEYKNVRISYKTNGGQSGQIDIGNIPVSGYQDILKTYNINGVSLSNGMQISGTLSYTVHIKIFEDQEININVDVPIPTLTVSYPETPHVTKEKIEVYPMVKDPDIPGAISWDITLSESIPWQASIEASDHPIQTYTGDGSNIKNSIVIDNDGRDNTLHLIIKDRRTNEVIYSKNITVPVITNTYDPYIRTANGSNEYNPGLVIVNEQTPDLSSFNLYVYSTMFKESDKITVKEMSINGHSVSYEIDRNKGRINIHPSTWPIDVETNTPMPLHITVSNGYQSGEMIINFKNSYSVTISVPDNNKIEADYVTGTILSSPQAPSINANFGIDDSIIKNTIAGANECVTVKPDGKNLKVQINSITNYDSSCSSVQISGLYGLQEGVYYHDGKAYLIPKNGAIEISQNVSVVIDNIPVVDPIFPKYYVLVPDNENNVPNDYNGTPQISPSNYLQYINIHVTNPKTIQQGPITLNPEDILCKIRFESGKEFDYALPQHLEFTYNDIKSGIKNVYCRYVIWPSPFSQTPQHGNISPIQPPHNNIKEFGGAYAVIKAQPSVEIREVVTLFPWVRSTIGDKTPIIYQGLVEDSSLISTTADDHNLYVHIHKKFTIDSDKTRAVFGHSQSGIMFTQEDKNLLASQISPATIRQSDNLVIIDPVRASDMGYDFERHMQEITNNPNATFYYLLSISNEGWLDIVTNKFPFLDNFTIKQADIKTNYSIENVVFFGLFLAHPIIKELGPEIQYDTTYTYGVSNVMIPLQAIIYGISSERDRHYTGIFDLSEKYNTIPYYKNTFNFTGQYAPYKRGEAINISIHFPVIENSYIVMLHFTVGNYYFFTHTFAPYVGNNDGKVIITNLSPLDTFTPLLQFSEQFKNIKVTSYLSEEDFYEEPDSHPESYFFVNLKINSEDYGHHEQYGDINNVFEYGLPPFNNDYRPFIGGHGIYDKIVLVTKWGDEYDYTNLLFKSDDPDKVIDAVLDKNVLKIRIDNALAEYNLSPSYIKEVHLEIYDSQANLMRTIVATWPSN